MLYLVNFKISYNAAPEQHLAVRIFNSKNELPAVYPLSRLDGSLWCGKAELQLSLNSTYTYDYVVMEDGKVVAEETVYPSRTISHDKSKGFVSCSDIWRYDIRQNNYGTAALAECMFPFKKSHSAITDAEGNFVFRINLLTPITKDIKVFVAGDVDALGNWNPEHALPMERASNYTYEARVNIDKQQLQYKYIILFNGNTLWEEGDNRYAETFTAPDAISVLNDGWIRLPQFTDWRGAGIVIPLFSLHSATSDGIGDFLDLKKFVNWASAAGFSAIQLLPINDTTTFGTWRDSYPYNSVSSFALNPIYISLKAAGHKTKAVFKSADATSVDYESVYKYKIKELNALYNNVKATLNGDKNYEKFVKSNEDWLDSYAKYCALRDKYHTLDFEQWKADDTGTMLQQKQEFYKFVQFLAFSQMEDVRKFARSKHIILKGDIPIGVNLYSCDVWQNPELFNKDMSTGAPPDYFSEDGQNWGFPTYNWDEMRRKDNYAWWKARLGVMSRLFDAYRIDHVLGFFRIWEIPRPQESAKYGHFSPALPYSETELLDFGFAIKPEHVNTLFVRDNACTERFQPMFTPDKDAYNNLNDWQKHAYNAVRSDFYGHRNEELWEKGAIEKLGIITKTSGMLACAEDLGMLPYCAGSVLEKLGILSLDIQSMPKQPGVEFDNPAQYPYRSVATLTTHDMPSFRLWWNRYPENAKRYAQQMLGIADIQSADPDSNICTQVLASHLSSPAMLCMISFQDWTGICDNTRSENLEAEQINDPANNKQYWRYKAHMSVEDLEQAADFTSKIRTMIAASQRDLLS